MTDAARSSSRMGWLSFGPPGAPRRSSGRESTGGGVAAPRGRLFRKYVLLIVGLVSLVLLLNSALDFWFAYDENKAALFRIQQEKAGSAARRIEQFVDEIERQLGWTTAPQWAASPLEQRRFDYVRLLRQVPAITELIQLDDAGKEQLKVSRLAMDVVGSEKDYSGSPGFVEAKKNRVWFSPVYFRKESEPYMTVALARAGRNAGVTVAEVNLKLIWDVITGLKIGQGGYAYVVDRDGRLIAHPDISLVLRNTDLANLPQVAAALAEAPSLPSPAGGGGLGWGQPIDQAAMVAKGINGNSVLTAHAPIAPLGWTVFVELPLSEALAPLYGSALRTAGLLALALVLATLAALLLARRMTVPIRELQAGAARIGSGELDRRIDIQTGDELEDLAGDFNRMAGDLQKSYADLEKKVEDRTAELKEALDQQTATAEVLGVINSSPGDLAPVFDAMLEKAMRLCEAAFGMLLTFDGERFQVAAHRGLPILFIEYMAITPAQPGPSGGQARVLRGEKIVHFADMRDDQAYRDGTNPNHRAMVDLGGARTGLVVPLRKDDAVVGTFTIYRQEVRLFSDKQIALLQNFAAQAVIAMENARLITETREALDQQTATAEVLGVINSSPGDLAPVFRSIVEKAHTLCDAACGSLQLWDGEKFRGVAMRGFSEAMVEQLRLGYSPSDMPCQRLVEGERVVHCVDLAEIDSPVAREGGVKLGGVRTILYVALRKDDVLLGQIVAARQEVRPFSEKEIALVESFAAQAVIAMENARLITETREALEQQTATAEVLRVINSSPGELAPVFDAVLDKATRFCDAAFGTLWTYDGERFKAVALRQVPEAYAEFLSQAPLRPVPFSGLGRVAAGESVAHFVDVAANEAYRGGDPALQALLELGKARSTVAVPLRKEDTVLGAITAYRQEVRPFSEKQIALLQNFAAQAVIAMENARLLTETREALEQQTATADVLGVINSSPGDLAPVFDAILEKAHTLCGAEHGSLGIYDGDYFRAVASRGYPASVLERLQHGFHGLQNPVTRPLFDGARFVQIPDLGQIDHPIPKAVAALGGFRTALFVPLRKDGRLLGHISASRQEVRPFAEKEVALLENFAAQAVIAMENARLITETREALEQQTATAEVLQVINSSPGDLAPVFDAMLEKAHTLCGAAHGSLQLYDGENLHAVATHAVSDKFADILRQGYRAADSPASQALIEGKPFAHIADCAEIDHPVFRGAAELAGIRTVLFVPLRKDGAFLGLISAARLEVRPFSEKEIALLQNFAAQAVIAMENARLITETREALEQQTATAEVLRVINSSPGDLTPVFETILEKAHTLCGAAHGALGVYDSDYNFRLLAARGYPEPLVERFRQGFAGLTNPVTRPLIDGAAFVHTPDLADIDHPIPQAVAKLGGFHTGLFIPLRKDDRLLGHISAARSEVRPFSEKEIGLLENFAAQAVIAMENARLITETREALEQQTATAEVLQVINSSPGDLAPVFDAMLDKATRLCEASFGIMQTYNGERFETAALHRVPATLAEWRQHDPLVFGPGTAPARIVAGEGLVHTVDLMAEEAYQRGDPSRRALVDLGGARSHLIVALRKDSALLGTIAVYRPEVRPFTDKQVALLQNFAAQAVIAMENARLITETREALEQQTATAEVLQVINSSPGDLAPVFDAILEKAHSLCRAAYGSLQVYDGEYFRAVAMRGLPEELANRLQQGYRGSDTPASRPLVEGKDVVQISDLAEIDHPMPRHAVELAGVRTLLSVALRKDEALLGLIVAGRKEVRTFTDKEIALLQNFAAQAVIAMENARLITETREALEQQTATAEVLGVINSSPGDLAPVFDAILEKAHTLCGAAEGSLLLYDHEHFRAVAMRGVPEPFADRLRHGYRGSDTPASQPLMAGARFVHIPDLAEVEHPMARAAVEHSGNRTLLSVPLRKGDALFGMIVATRQEVRPFTDKQIALLQNFAAQAVIAMENVRLITELRQRTRDLQESLDYQTATSDVLKVISQSGAELEPVLDMLVETAARICQADKAFVNQLRDGLYRTSASFGFSAEYNSFMIDNPIAPGRGTVTGRVALESRVIQIEDVASDREYTLRGWEAQWRTGLGVPLFRGTTVIGVIFLARSRVEPFTEKQIELVTTFADQAVIAIENARLLGDLQGRTHDLQESLEYQTATSDVLKVISQSGAELEPVLQTLVETAARICAADKAVLQQLRDGLFRIAASSGLPQEWEDYRARNPIAPDRGTPIGRMALERKVVHVEDALTDPEYTDLESRSLGEFRTMLAVPLFRGGTVIGGLFLARSHVEPFTEKQIALVTTFADQAVIAIENARLFNELRARTTELGSSVAELKMLSEVGQAVSSTLDLRTVLSTILNASLGVTWANAGAVFRYSRAERAFRLVEAMGWDEALAHSVRELHVAETESAMGEAVARRMPIQLPDLAQRASYPLRDVTLAAGFHSALIVPLVGAERILGAIILMRQEAGEFPPETVRLMQTLASQSVLAIQNARLFREIADKSEQLALASQHKSQFLANMSHELRTPLNAILGYAELLVDGIYGVLPDRPKGVLERIQNNGKHLLALINDVLDLAKIEAGQLTLTLEDYSLPEVVKSVVTATEPLATSKGLKFTAAVQDGLPMAHGDARRVSQVLLNLVGNAIKFTDEGEVEIRAATDKGQFMLTVRDTGPGIPDADQERIFGEFQQIDNTNTRKKGGTGLGLAISKRMVEMQGGTISVDSVLGEGSTFRVVLPVHVDEMMEEAA